MTHRGRVPPIRLASFLAALALFALLAAVAGGPQGAPAASYEPSGPRASAVERAAAHLRANAGAYGWQRDAADLRLINRREGLGAEHVRYEQTVYGIPVLGSYVAVSLPKDARKDPHVVSRYLPDARPEAVTSIAAPQAALPRAAAALGVSEANLKALDGARLVYFPTPNKTLIPAWETIVQTSEPFDKFAVVTDAATGEVISRQSILRFDSGRIFDHNPGAAGGGVAPAEDCDTLAHQNALAGLYTDVALNEVNGGQGRLIGPWVDLTAPGIEGGYKGAGQADEPNRVYNYNCRDDRFEEVMVYHFVDTTQRHIQALGFNGTSGVMNRKLSAHAHFFDDCNAFYDPVDLGLHFGDGDNPTCDPLPPTDAAEDGDVIVHEYGHAVQDHQVPGWGYSPIDFTLMEEARSMGEGFSDFLAAAINGDPCIGEYATFGFNECGGNPGLRSIENSMDYPGGFNSCPLIDVDGDEVGDIVEEHCGGLVWGGVLWDLAQNLGAQALSAQGAGSLSQAARDLALQLVLEGQFFMSPLVTFNEAAAAICMADDILYDGAHQDIIAGTFAARGFSAGNCLHEDQPYIYMRVRHTYSGDLELNLLVGADSADPDCAAIVGEPSPLVFIPDLYVFALPLDGSTCADLLPPSSQVRWWLEVRDTLPEDTGRIEAFEVLLSGGSRCIAANTPVSIPDAPAPETPGPYVYARVDCSLFAEPAGPATPTPSPTPSGPTPTPTPPGQTPTPTPEGQTPTPTATPNATPTPTPALAFANGDVDCSGAVNSVDALKVSRFVVRLPVNQTEPCTDIGDGILALTAPSIMADVDCSNAVNAVDALKILRHVVGLPVNQPSGCPPIGQ